MSEPRIPAFRTRELEEDYLRRVARLENDSRNAQGSDKTWVERADRIAREHFKKAVRVR